MFSRIQAVAPQAELPEVAAGDAYVDVPEAQCRAVFESLKDDPEFLALKRAHTD